VRPKRPDRDRLAAYRSRLFETPAFSLPVLWLAKETIPGSTGFSPLKIDAGDSSG
jgi:hypothetical protein